MSSFRSIEQDYFTRLTLATFGVQLGKYSDYQQAYQANGLIYRSRYPAHWYQYFIVALFDKVFRPIGEHYYDLASEYYPEIGYN